MSELKLPLRFEKRNQADCFIIDADDKELVAMWSTVEYLPTAKTILKEVVHRCNCHDALVAACEDALVGMSEAFVKFERKHHKVGQAILTKTFRIVEAALAEDKKKS